MQRFKGLTTTEVLRKPGLLTERPVISSTIDVAQLAKGTPVIKRFVSKGPKTVLTSEQALKAGASASAKAIEKAIKTAPKPQPGIITKSTPVIGPAVVTRKLPSMPAQFAQGPAQLPANRFGVYPQQRREPPARIRSKGKIGQQLPSKQRSGQASIQSQMKAIKSSLRQKPKTASEQIQGPILTPAQSQAQKRAQLQKVRLKQAQIQLQKQKIIPPLVFTTAKPAIVPTVKPMFKGPALITAPVSRPITTKRKGKPKKKKPKRGFRYTPTLVGIFTGKTIVKAPKLLTGLGIRGVLKRRK